MVKIAKPESGATLATISGHGSSSNFVVESLDSSLQEVDLLVNVIGSYSGTVLMDVQDGQETARLKIQYPGTWTAVLRPISAVPEFTTTAAGNGDRVFTYLGDAQGLRITNRARATFWSRLTATPATCWSTRLATTAARSHSAQGRNSSRSSPMAPGR